MANFTDETLAQRIQYTLIETGVTQEQVKAVCDTCLEYGFAAAMLPGCWVTMARKLLGTSRVKVASAVDFPLGIMSTSGKACEAASLIEAGADELDMAVNLGYLRSGLLDQFEADIAAVVQAAQGRPVKVMLELPLLSSEQREQAARRAMHAGARYLKNASSGAVGVATPEDIRFLRHLARSTVGVKASGGIRTRSHALALLDAGADLLGTSSAVAIVTGADRERSSVY